jgi:hypothetical protein
MPLKQIAEPSPPERQQPCAEAAVKVYRLSLQIMAFAEAGPLLGVHKSRQYCNVRIAARRARQYDG